MENTTNPRLTRRQTIKSFALMTAAFYTTGVVGPPRRARQVVEGRTTTLVSAQVEEGWARAATTELPAQLIGFDWEGSGPAKIEVRALGADGWSGWLPLQSNLDEGPDPDSHERGVRRTVGPAWVGHDISDVEVRLASGRVRDLKMHAVRSVEEALLLGTPPADAAAQPGIITRGQWGADESYRSIAPGCDGNPDYATDVRYAIVHHTVNSNTYGPGDSAALVRGIYYYHTHTNNWCDVGYNFLIDRYGQIFEGRAGGIERAVIGAHAGGFNTASTGIALLGTFGGDPVPADMYASLVSLLRWKLGIHRVDPLGQLTVTSSGSSRYPSGTRVTLNNISGHRDVSQTECPGDVAYQKLGQLRRDVGGSEEPGSPHRLDVFARGTNNELRHLYYDGRWRDWESLGGNLTSDPTAVSWGLGRLDVFARGPDNEIEHKWFGGLWGGWESLGGVHGSGPDVASWGPGRLDVFARGTNNEMGHNYFDGHWHQWESLGGNLSSDPSAVSWGPGRIDLFARGVNNDLQHTWFDGRWHQWESLGGNLTSGPDVASWAPGRLDVFARGTSNELRHTWFDGGWGGWESLGGNLSSDPTSVSWDRGRLDVFARGAGNDLQHTWFDGGWGGWESLGGNLTSGPDVASWA